MTCRVAGFHQISNHFSKFLWDASEFFSPHFSDLDHANEQRATE
jgi:hypothetical protein